MDLLEYQAKELFKKVGIPVLPAQRIDRPTDIKALQIRYPVVLKSQVSVGNRGKSGGVRFVENTIDAIAAARTIFNLPIGGEYPQVLLAEAKYDTSLEFYLAIAIDRLARCPILLGSAHGFDRVERVLVEGQFSQFYARRLALKMGLEGPLMLAVSETIERMYRLMIDYDLDSVEINPLGVDGAGEVMALDGKIRANPKAIDRHPDLQKWRAERVKQHPPSPNSIYRGQGNIGILCHGSGIALSLLDAIHRGGGRVSRCVTIDVTAPSGYERAIALLTDPQVKVLLVNLVGSDLDLEPVAKLASEHHPKIIWRLLEYDLPTSIALSPSPIKFFTDFDRAIVETINAANESVSE
jgi:succinyl-CoA synthetase beta subunit